MDTRAKYADYVITSMVAGIEPIVVDHARDALLSDVDGADYVDLFSGIAVVNVGHVHPRVAAAAKRQIDDLVHCCSYVYYVPIVADLAERLAAIAPGRLQKSFFGNSGAEAVEGALRLAKAATGRHEIIALQASFHGRTAGALAVTGNSRRRRRNGPYQPGVAFAPAPNAYRCRMCHGECTLACADAIEDILRYETSDDVAAVIVEPVLGEGGIIVCPDGYLRRVREICNAYDMLLIVDEVQSGFGRTGTMFAIERSGVEPDIMTVAKGIASGFPLGAFIARSEIADAFRPGEHLSTFGGNPVSCAAALATIEVLLEDQLPQRAAALGEHALDRLRLAQREHSVVGDVRGIGLMIGVELVEDPATKEPAPQRAAEVRRLCRERGVLVGVGGYAANVVRVQPPLTIPEPLFDRALGVLEEALATVDRDHR